MLVTVNMSLLFVPSHSQTRLDRVAILVRLGVGQAGFHLGQIDFSPMASLV